MRAIADCAATRQVGIGRSTRVGRSHEHRREPQNPARRDWCRSVGIESLAAAVGEERDTLEDVIEPFLIQQGLLQRTPRGRVAAVAAYRHFGIAEPAGGDGTGLF